MPWIITLLITIAIDIVATLLRPHQPDPAIAETRTPTASASAPIPWVFGEVIIDQTNVLWVGDVSTRQVST